MKKDIKKMCRFQPAFFLLMILIFSTAPSRAEDLPTIRVVTSTFPPFSYVEDGTAKGIAVERARHIFADIGISPNIEVYPWARAYTIAEQEPNTLIFSMGRNEKREKLFKWVGEIAGFDVHIYRSNRRQDLNISSITELKRHKVLGLIKDIKSDCLISRGIDVATVRSEEIAVRMILAGRADLMPSDRNAMDYRLEKMGLGPDAMVPVLAVEELSNPLYAAFNKDTADSIVERFRGALARINPR